MNTNRDSLINVSQLPLFDPAEYLNTEAGIEAFLSEARPTREELASAEAIVERARKRWNLSSPGDRSSSKP